MSKIYVASSWRNEHHHQVVTSLRLVGHEVYDFKSDKGFHWGDIDENWENWSQQEYIDALNHPLAQRGFDNDYKAMQWADTFVLVHPCGQSSHLELGWACGAGKRTIILLEEKVNPELMVKMVDHISPNMEDLLEVLNNSRSYDVYGHDYTCKECNGTGSNGKVGLYDVTCTHCDGHGVIG